MFPLFLKQGMQRFSLVVLDVVWGSWFQTGGQKMDFLEWHVLVLCGTLCGFSSFLAQPL